MTALRPGPASGIGGYVTQEVPMSQIHFQWQFNETISTYASCLDDKEANSLVQNMVHSNVIEPAVSLICKYAGVAYEGKYNLLSGRNALVGDEHGKVIEEMMYKSYQDHVCDDEAWSGPLCMNTELHRAVTYMWQGWLRLTTVWHGEWQTWEELAKLNGVTPWHFADYPDLAMYYNPILCRFFKIWRSVLSSKRWQMVKRKHGTEYDETVASLHNTKRPKVSA